MKLYSLEAKQLLPLPLAEAWRFFSDPRNLSQLTPAWLSFETTSDVPPQMYAGLIITYRIRPLFNLPSAWVTEITHVREPHYFVDEQRFGPYRFWHHQHFFREAAGGTEVRDLVHYALRGGPLAGLADALLVRRRLEEIFSFRREVLARMFGAR